MQTLTLRNPIEINGNTRSSFNYDIDLLTIAEFSAAEAAARKRAGNVAAIAEFDYTFHFYLGAQAIISADPSIDITDLERIKGLDVMALVEVGRFFTYRSEAREESGSDEQLGTSPESSALPSQTSTECPSSTSFEITEMP